MSASAEKSDQPLLNEQSPQAQTSFDRTRHSHFIDVVYSTGPSPIRDSECGICLEQMEQDHKTLTHTSCQNTFHETCLNEAILYDYQTHEPSSCPMCRSDVFLCWPVYTCEDQLTYWLQKDHFHQLQDVEIHLSASRIMDDAGLLAFSHYWDQLKAIAMTLPNPSRVRYAYGIVLLYAVRYSYAADMLERNTYAVDKLGLMSVSDIHRTTRSHCLTLFTISARKLVFCINNNINRGGTGMHVDAHFRFLPTVDEIRMMNMTS